MAQRSAGPLPRASLTGRSAGPPGLEEGNSSGENSMPPEDTQPTPFHVSLAARASRPDAGTESRCRSGTASVAAELRRLSAGPGSFVGTRLVAQRPRSTVSLWLAHAQQEVMLVWP